jgi:hypothetical protein
MPSRAQVGEPVPGEDALGGHDEALAKRRHRFEQRLRARRQVAVQEHLAVAIEDAEVQGLRVQIDPAPMLVRSVVESHRFPSCADARMACLHPAYSAWSRRRRGPR